MIKSIIYSLLAVVLIFFLYKIIKYNYLKPSVSMDETAHDFSVIEKSGETFQLSSLQGKYVLLQFWGSWCGPCRKENMELFPLYQEYLKTKNPSQIQFEIVSIALEPDSMRWSRAIERDSLIWPHHILGSALFDSKLAKLYGVKQIPTTFMLDQNSKVIGVNWPPDKIRTFLSRQSAN